MANMAHVKARATRVGIGCALDFYPLNFLRKPQYPNTTHYNLFWNFYTQILPVTLHILGFGSLVGMDFFPVPYSTST